MPKVTCSQKFAFAQRSGAMKAPVGLLSDRTVLRSKMVGLCPDKFQFAALIIFLFWELLGARPLHLAILLRKTVPLLKSPTGAFIAALRLQTQTVP